MYAEAVFIGVNANNKSGLADILNKRMGELNASGKIRIQKLVTKLAKL
jgi:ABC-type amino acid transport substrate-binding protein